MQGSVGFQRTTSRSRFATVSPRDALCNVIRLDRREPDAIDKCSTIASLNASEFSHSEAIAKIGRADSHRTLSLHASRVVSMTRWSGKSSQYW